MRELADAGVDLNVRSWVKNEDYSETRWELLEKIKVAFDLKGITIPYPQVDVHMDRHADLTPEKSQNKGWSQNQILTPVGLVRHMAQRGIEIAPPSCPSRLSVNSAAATP